MTIIRASSAKAYPSLMPSSSTQIRSVAYGRSAVDEGTTLQRQGRSRDVFPARDRLLGCRSQPGDSEARCDDRYGVPWRELGFTFAVGKSWSIQRLKPPWSGRTRVMPVRFNWSATRALVASFGQEQ